MNIKKIIAMAAALTMTTAMFASCGDTEESSSKADAGTTTTTTTAPADDANAGADESEAAADSTADATSGADSTADANGGSGEAYIDEVTGLECQIPSADYVPVTEFEGYDAFLMFADKDWMWSNFGGQGYPEDDRGDGAYGVDADVTGDGEYTVSITTDSIGAEDPVLGSVNPQIVWDGEYVLPASGAVVFCVDITGICDGTLNYKNEELKKQQLEDGEGANVNKHIKGKYTGQDISVEVTSIKADGEEVEFDPSKIIYGNIEDSNNCYRIEIYNDYGESAKDPAIDKNSLMFAKSLEVSFKISGLTQEG